MSATTLADDTANGIGRRLNPPNGKGGPKNKTGAVRRYNWTALSDEGRLEILPIGVLNIDQEYQRHRIRESRVTRIAAEWSWMGCCVLGVCKRPDGTYWVYDGQHRLLAAKKRGDIKTLPCWVFEVVDKHEEAAGFIAVNTVRGPIRAIEAFKSRFVAKDATALEVAALVEAIGYRIADGAGQFTLSCVAAIEDVLVRDRETAETCLMLCADIYNGECINSRVLKGLAYIHAMLKKTGDRITRADIRKKLINAGPEAITRAINNALAYHARGGEAIFADGIVRLINHKKRSQKIPSVVK